MLNDLKNDSLDCLKDLKGKLSKEDNLLKLKTILKWTKRALIAIFVWLFLWINIITHVEPTEAGIGINWLNGDLRLLDKSGWHITAPWVWVTKIETSPMRVGISTSSRGYSVKLVQFQKEYYKEFIETEGWYFYWWYNRLSFNIGYDRMEEYRGFRDIMRAYAYSDTRYPFIKILNQYQK